jgi:hypothetical protein
MRSEPLITLIPMLRMSEGIFLISNTPSWSGQGKYFLFYILIWGCAVGQLVEAVRCKPKGGLFDS